MELKLPEFAFLDGNCHNGDSLKGRTVVIHIRSASILEFFEQDRAVFNDGILFVDFEHKNIFDEVENQTCALHYCATLDRISDEKMIIENIILPAIEWYKEYMDWEDGNIANDMLGEYLAENN